MQTQLAYYLKDGKTLHKLFQLTRDNYPITACLTLSQYGIPQATANQINCFINATLINELWLPSCRGSGVMLVVYG